MALEWLLQCSRLSPNWSELEQWPPSNNEVIVTALSSASAEDVSLVLKKTHKREDLSALARLEDNLRRAELGLLLPPNGVDVPSFLLSDPKLAAKPSLPKISTLDALLKNYFASIPKGSLEPSTLHGMGVHCSHLKRGLGKKLSDSRTRSGSPATLHRGAVECRRNSRTGDQWGNHPQGNRHAPHRLELVVPHGVCEEGITQPGLALSKAPRETTLPDHGRSRNLHPAGRTHSG